jgi:hypothetical protein
VTSRTTGVRSEQDAYNEICAYTLDHARRDPSFIHQHVVDAYAAQRADAGTKPISLTFALAGLYLHVEHQISGAQVQRIHMKLARRKHQWPRFDLPADRGNITACDVIAVPPGPDRDRAIHAWCAAVWSTFRDSHPRVIECLREHGIDVEAG